jgi:hypothetical protein
MWVHRNILERRCHKHACFVTLTYDELSMPARTDPRFGRVGTLVPSDMSNFIKRLRRRLEPNLIRFYGVGEYGEDKLDFVREIFHFGRPHYHILIYNLEKSEETKVIIERCWQRGIVDVGEVTDQSIGYVVQYAVKKMTGHDDRRLHGRYPEFSNMSRMPGIGVNGLWDVASAIMEHGLDEWLNDVPSAARMNGNLVAYGRTMKQHLRRMIGREINAPEEVIKAMEDELSFVRYRAEMEEKSVKQVLLEMNEGKYELLRAKLEINKQRRKL